MKVISPLRRVLPYSVTMNLWRYLCCLYLRAKYFSEQLKWRFLEKKTQKMIKIDDQMRKKKSYISVFFARFEIHPSRMDVLHRTNHFCSPILLKQRARAVLLKKSHFFVFFQYNYGIHLKFPHYSTSSTTSSTSTSSSTIVLDWFGPKIT